MHAYLIQHAEALPSEADPVRPLSEKGQADARAMGEYLLRHTHIYISGILHSGKERAAQTADLLAASFGITSRPATGLNPSDDPAVWARQLTTSSKDVMLVGHLPHLQRLAGLLLGNDAGLSLLHFRNGGVLCLERDDAHAWRIEWMLTPALLPEGKKAGKRG